MLPMTPLQSWAFLALVFALVTCLVWLVHEIEVRTTQHDDADFDPHAETYDADEPYDYEKHGL